MEYKQFYIVTAPLVDSLRAEDFPMPHPPIRFYPDGSLWTDDHQRLVRKTGKAVNVPAALTRNGSCRFRPLAVFSGDPFDAPNYQILFPGSCDWLGEHETWPLTYPGIAKNAAEDEYDLGHVRVLIRLRKKFTAALAKELADVLRQWFVEIGSVGVFGEAGLKAISPALRWLDKCAGFELDATGSGQETLNTLYLAVLNWGMNQKRPLVLTDLAADKNEPVFASDQTVPLT